MKTVMKKMFCLMLVAVLMVGVMPFQAFAAESVFVKVIEVSGEAPVHTFSIDVDLADANWKDIIIAKAKEELPTHEPTGDTSAAVESGVFYIKMHPKCTGSATCPAFDGEHASNCEKIVCSKCGAAAHLGAKCCNKCNQDGHLASACPNYCDICVGVMENPSNHAHCTLCKGLNGAHTDNCDNNPYKVKTCLKCSRTYRDIDGAHICCDRCKELHATANCPYCTTCWAKGDKVTTHATSAHCTTCNGINGHLSGYPCYTAPAAGNVNLYVWANLYTGQVKTGSVLLDTITGLSGSEHVYQVVANNEGRIRSKIPAGYGWTGHIYYEQDPKTVLQVHSNLSVSAEDDVVINLYTDQKLVVARVHTNKTYAIDHTINIDGFTVGQTITSNDVLKAVQKHYNVSSMKMYTPAEWEKVVSGKTGTVIPNYEVHGGDNIIDVYVTGSYKTTSGTTYKADSSNPKTGDMIFAPAMVLGLSASALAVLFYLNKKRAF